MITEKNNGIPPRKITSRNKYTENQFLTFLNGELGSVYERLIYEKNGFV